MGTKPHILYVEDDINLSFVTRDNLEMHGYQITYCADGAAALAVFAQHTFDLCILDVMLPKVDGFTIARQIRERNAHVPILFLSARSLKEDRIFGLRTGADDYITKPFSIEELVLRVEVFLRRKQVSTTPQKSYFYLGGYAFDFNNLRLSMGDKVVDLTLKEGQLLNLFCRHVNQVLRREDILRTLWGEDDYFMGRSLDVFVSRLRKHLQTDPSVRIENIHRVGFCLRVEEGN